MKKIIGLALSLAVAACATAPEPYDYTAFRAEDPRSIVILPALNNTTHVEAAEWFVSTASRPFAERGYYVYPAWMVKQTLDQSGLSDASLVYAADTRRLDQVFDCDAAMYVSIDRWDSQYVVINTTTTVGLAYELRSCKSGEVLWASAKEVAYSPQSQSTGSLIGDLVAQAVVSAIEKGRPNYIPLAQQANGLAALTPGQGLPAGPYLADQYGLDGDVFPSGTATVGAGD
jgi:hypothetical protein